MSTLEFTNAGKALFDTMAPPVGGKCKARPREYKDGEDFGLYLNHFNRVAAANQWSDEVKLVQLETTLRGKAQREFEVFIEESPEITWAEITGKLKIELEPSTQRSLDVFGQMRLEGRSPKEFYAALVRQSKVAHGEMGDEATHVVVRAQMLMVLPKKLRMDASKQKELTGLNKVEFLDLLTRVYDAELKEEVEDQQYEPTICQVTSGKALTMEDRVRKLEQEFSGYGKDMTELKSMMKDMCAGLNQGKGQQRRDRFSGNYDNVTCYRCQEKGHFARECRNEKACWKCAVKGHVYAECSKNPKNM